MSLTDSLILCGATRAQWHRTRETRWQRDRLSMASFHPGFPVITTQGLLERIFISQILCGEVYVYTWFMQQQQKKAPGSHQLFSGEFHRRISFNPWITKTGRVTKTVNLRSRASLFSFHYCEIIRHWWCKRAMLGELKKKPRKKAEQMWNVVICPETASSKINVGTDELRDSVLLWALTCGLTFRIDLAVKWAAQLFMQQKSNLRFVFLKRRRRNVFPPPDRNEFKLLRHICNAYINYAFSFILFHLTQPVSLTPSALMKAKSWRLACQSTLQAFLVSPDWGWHFAGTMRAATALCFSAGSS